MKNRELEPPREAPLLIPLFMSLLFGVGLTFAGLTVAGHYGLDFGRDLYIALASAVGVNAAIIVLPPLLRLAAPRPAELALPYPPASSLVLCDSLTKAELAQDTI